MKAFVGEGLETYLGVIVIDKLSNVTEQLFDIFQLIHAIIAHLVAVHQRFDDA